MDVQRINYLTKKLQTNPKFNTFFFYLFRDKMTLIFCVRIRQAESWIYGAHLLPPSSSSNPGSKPSCHHLLPCPADPAPPNRLLYKQQSATNTGRIKMIANIFRTHFNQKGPELLAIHSTVLCKAFAERAAASPKPVPRRAPSGLHLGGGLSALSTGTAPVSATGRGPYRLHAPCRTDVRGQGNFMRVF